MDSSPSKNQGCCLIRIPVNFIIYWGMPTALKVKFQHEAAEL